MTAFASASLTHSRIAATSASSAPASATAEAARRRSKPMADGLTVSVNFSAVVRTTGTPPTRSVSAHARVQTSARDVWLHQEDQPLPVGRALRVERADEDLA